MEDMKVETDFLANLFLRNGFLEHSDTISQFWLLYDSSFRHEAIILSEEANAL
jgi:hypothetical protein